MGLYELIPNYSYVSFDIFDTLIKRNVAKPSDLFILMEKNCVDILGVESGFTNKRIKAEGKARERYNRPVTIHEIYGELKEEFSSCLGELMQIEIDTEIQQCSPNPEYTKLLEKCVEERKTVILISDMYLPSEVITKMLQKCGILGYTSLYNSCEQRAKKSDGSLFKKVLFDYQLSSSQLLHIGDNLRSDCLVPALLGIRTVRVDNDQDKICRIPKEVSLNSAFEFRTLQACLRNCSREMNEWEKQGCKIFGPLLYGFTQWLLHRLRNDGIYDVFFLARDGYMLKRAFEEIGAKNINTHYLLCSRRSYQVPLIWKKPSFEDVTLPLRVLPKITLRTFIERIGLDPDEYADVALLYNLSLDREFSADTFYNSNEIRDFYEVIKEDVLENSKKEYEGLVAYCRQQNFGSRIAVVDIGYQGSMQYALSNILKAENIDVHIKGYYVSIDTGSTIISEGKVDAEGFISDVGIIEQFQNAGVQRGLFEIQFLSPEGSTHRFSIKDNQVDVEFAPFEYENNDRQKVDEISIIDRYQNGAVAFVEYMYTNFDMDVLIVTPEISIYPFIRFSNRPTLKQVRTWGRFRFYGLFQTYVALPQKKSIYLRHPKRLKVDFKHSIWRIGFMRSLFRITLPYNKIINVYYRMTEKKRTNQRGNKYKKN